VIAVLMNGRPLAFPSSHARYRRWSKAGPRHPARRRSRGRAVWRLQPWWQAAGHIPACNGTDPDLLQPPEHGRPADSANHYTSKYLDIPWTPLFPFGYGLSYTTFAYANLRVSAPRIRARDSLVVSVDVRNSGDRAGDEVVQLYIRDDVASERNL